MAGRNKEDFLYEFAGTGLANNCRSVEDLERRFYNWMKRSNYRLVSFGKDYFNNEFSYSVDYTKKILDNDPQLASYFGLAGGYSYGSPQGGYGGSSNGYGSSYGNNYGTNYGTGRGSSGGTKKRTSSGTGRGRKSSGYSNGGGYNDNEGYSLKGMFNHYKNQFGSSGGSSGGGISVFGGFIIAVVVLVLIYKILGPAVYAFITSGAIFKLICFAIGGFASYKILTSKNMGWPIYIKLGVLFVIWLVLLNYDF